MRTDCGSENGTMAASQYLLIWSIQPHGMNINNQLADSVLVVHFQKGKVSVLDGAIFRPQNRWYINGSHEHHCPLRYSFSDVIQKEQLQDLTFQIIILSRTQLPTTQVWVQRLWKFKLNRLN